MNFDAYTSADVVDSFLFFDLRDTIVTPELFPYIFPAMSVGGFT